MTRRSRKVTWALATCCTAGASNSQVRLASVSPGNIQPPLYAFRPGKAAVSKDGHTSSSPARSAAACSSAAQ